jgi:hypothetical protein
MILVLGGRATNVPLARLGQRSGRSVLVIIRAVIGGLASVLNALVERFGDRLPGSRPPRLERPCGPSHAIGYADFRPGIHSPGVGAYEEDGGE